MRVLWGVAARLGNDGVPPGCEERLGVRAFALRDRVWCCHVAGLDEEERKEIQGFLVWWR